MKKILCAAIALVSSACQGTRPQNIGVNEGHLTSCPDSPNCISTRNSDALHKVEPFPIKGSAEASLAIIRSIVKDWPRTEVVVDKGRYLHVEFTSKLMRFVDDVEFFATEPGSEIEIRSASRIGRKDFGVNRERIESIRKMYLERP